MIYTRYMTEQLLSQRKLTTLLESAEFRTGVANMINQSRSRAHQQGVMSVVEIGGGPVLEGPLYVTPREAPGVGRSVSSEIYGEHIERAGFAGIVLSVHSDVPSPDVPVGERSYPTRRQLLRHLDLPSGAIGATLVAGGNETAEMRLYAAGEAYNRAAIADLSATRPLDDPVTEAQLRELGINHTTLQYRVARTGAAVVTAGIDTLGRLYE